MHYGMSSRDIEVSKEEYYNILNNFNHSRSGWGGANVHVVTIGKKSIDFGYEKTSDGSFCIDWLFAEKYLKRIMI